VDFERQLFSEWSNYEWEGGEVCPRSCRRVSALWNRRLQSEHLIDAVKEYSNIFQELHGKASANTSFKGSPSSPMSHLHTGSPFAADVASRP
jgi:hypothetical protein